MIFPLHQMIFPRQQEPQAGRLRAQCHPGGWSSFLASKSPSPGRGTPFISSACASIRPTLHCRRVWQPTVMAAACGRARSRPGWKGMACPVPMKGRCVSRPILASSPAVTSAAIWWRRASAAASARCSTTGWWRASPASCRSAGLRWRMPWAGFGAQGARRCWRIRAVTSGWTKPVSGRWPKTSWPPGARPSRWWPEEIARFARWAKRLGIRASRGSAFHDPLEIRFDVGLAPPLPPGLVPVWTDWPEVQGP